MMSRFGGPGAAAAAAVAPRAPAGGRRAAPPRCVSMLDVGVQALGRAATLACAQRLYVSELRMS